MLCIYVQHLYFTIRVLGFSRWLSGKESACNSGNPGLIPGSGISPGEGNGNTLQYSCLENPMDSGAWSATAHGGRRELDMTVTEQQH